MASRPKQAEPRPAPRLYLVTPPVADASGFTADLAAALDAIDVAAVLLRLADGDERDLTNRVMAIAPLIQDKNVALLLDGHPEFAAPGDADGAHLRGIEDFKAAINILKPDRIAGVGALDSRHDAMTAAENGADYVLFGGPDEDVEATLERVAWWANVFEIPCVGYAGAADDIAPLVAAGTDFVALDFVWRDPRGAATALRDIAPQLRLPELAQ